MSLVAPRLSFHAIYLARRENYVSRFPHRLVVLWAVFVARVQTSLVTGVPQVDAVVQQLQDFYSDSVPPKVCDCVCLRVHPRPRIMRRHACGPAHLDRPALAVV